jgi:hypothetical protein
MEEGGEGGGRRRKEGGTGRKEMSLDTDQEG